MPIRRCHPSGRMFHQLSQKCQLVVWDRHICCVPSTSCSAWGRTWSNWRRCHRLCRPSYWGMWSECPVLDHAHRRPAWWIVTSLAYTAMPETCNDARPDRCPDWRRPIAAGTLDRYRDVRHREPRADDSRRSEINMISIVYMIPTFRWLITSMITYGHTINRRKTVTITTLIGVPLIVGITTNLRSTGAFVFGQRAKCDWDASIESWHCHKNAGRIRAYRQHNTIGF